MDNSSENTNSTGFKKSKLKPFPKQTEDTPITKTILPSEEIKKPIEKKEPIVSDIKPSITSKKTIKPKKKKEENLSPKTSNGEMRLNKFLSHAGIASRRKCDELIEKGYVTVNGNIITTTGEKVKLNDEVTYKGKKVHPEKKVYVLLNKPKDFVIKSEDETNNRTVMNLVKTVAQELKMDYDPQIFPLGTMEKDATGLLLLTNDEDVKKRLTKSNFRYIQVYKLALNKNLSYEDFEKIQAGVQVGEQHIKVEEISYSSSDTQQEIGIQIRTGENDFVEQLFDSLDYKIVRSDRMLYATLTKKDLPRGKWRFLTQKEVTRLKFSKTL